MNEYITLDGNKYAVSAGTYLDNWTRAFNSQMAAQIVRINFVDRGPGIHVFNMTLYLKQWPSSSGPYKAGITSDAITQYNALVASFSKIATAINYTDPIGNAVANGVYFTGLKVMIPQYSTTMNPAIECPIELQQTSGIIV